MATNIKKLLVVLGVTLFIFTVIAPMSSVLAKHLKYRKPYASVLTTADEEEDEDCTVETCGEADDGEEVDGEPVKSAPPPPPIVTKEEVKKEPVVEEKKAPVKETIKKEPVKEKVVEEKPVEKERTEDKKKAAAEEAAKMEAAKKAQVEELKQLEEKKKAEALEAENKAKEMAEKQKLEEELKMQEEEAKRLEELKKQAEEKALKRQEEDLRLQKEAEARRQEELKRLSEETKLKELFVEKLVAPPPSTFIAELKKAAGEDPEKVNFELVKKEAAFAVKKTESVGKEEVKLAVAEIIFQEELKKAKEASKRALIAKAAARKYKVIIKDNKEGLKTRGISNEAAVFLDPGLDPRAQLAVQDKEAFAHLVEKKLFGVPQDKTIDQLVKPTIGLPQGTTVATRGTAILAAVPEANKDYELHATDTSGRDRIVSKQTSSENKKLIFTVNSLPPGKYALQVKPVSPLGARFPYFASALNAGLGQASDPVLIEAKSDPGIPQPVVESIEGLSIAGLRDIQVEADAEGKITVSGSSDITTMVIGIFSSAIFTSAMLADIDSGRFEVVSPRALESGNHEVVIYASRPEEATQSVPVKVKFRLIQAAKAEAPGVSGPVVIDIDSRPSAPEKKFPLVPFLAFGGLAVLLIGIGIFLKKSKKMS